MNTSHLAAAALACGITLACSAQPEGRPPPFVGAGGGAQVGSGGASAGANSSGGATLGQGGGGITLPNAGAAGMENCGFQNFNLQRQPADILLVLDRSASMLDEPDGASDTTPKWDLVVPALTDVVSTTNTSVAWA